MTTQRQKDTAKRLLARELSQRLDRARDIQAIRHGGSRGTAYQQEIARLCRVALRAVMEDRG